jgi:hypothetical protein
MQEARKELSLFQDFDPKPTFLKRSSTMKKTIVRIILVTFLLLASGVSLIADGTPVPICLPPNRNCSVK